MSNRPVRLLIFAALAGLLLVAAFRIFQTRVGRTDPATGNLISHTDSESTFPLAAPAPQQPAVESHELQIDKQIAVRPRNLILFVGDGMGIGAISAADALLDNPTGSLGMIQTDNLGLVRTWAANDLTTDSAASATSLATGFKTNKKMLGMLPDHRLVVNLFEAARERGFATGVITTSGLADATPAAFTSHIDHRDKYHLILEEILASDTDLLIGGNWVRKDKAIINPLYLKLVANIDDLAAEQGYHLVADAAGLETAELPLLAFFPPRAEEQMDHGPPLADSTRIAIELLSADPDGFVLVVECETTDEAAHNLDIEGTLGGVRELDEAVVTALDLVRERGDTLILITADHDTGSPGVIGGDYEKGKATIRWSTDAHSSQYVPIFAHGPGAELFNGILDNTEIPRLAARLLGLKNLPQLADSKAD